MKTLAFPKFHESIRISDIRPSRYVYYMAYVLELIFYSVRGNFLPIGVKVFGLSGATIVKVGHMVASLVVMLLWTKKFKPLLRTSVIVMLVGFVPFLFLPVGIPRFVFGLIGNMGLGGVVTGARCGYAYASNNAERLFGIMLMFFSVTIVKTLDFLKADGIFVMYVLPLTLLLMLCFCILRFKEEDLEVKEESTKEDAKGLYWALAYFIVYFAVDGYIAGLVSKSRQEYVFVIVGSVLVGVLMLAVFCGLRISTWHLWNFFFVCSIGMGLFAVLAPKIGTTIPQDLFSGLSYMGWPLCIYTLACAQRKFASYRLLKQCTLIYVLLTPITTLSSDWVYDFYPEAMPIATLVFTLTATILLLMFSPMSYQHLFSALWIKSLYKPDMELLQEKVENADRFGKYELTPRQKEVATLLLAAKTRRQIAGELGLSESTVKMHVSELYKRLDINSRAELFKIFGVSEEYEKTS